MNNTMSDKTDLYSPCDFFLKIKYLVLPTMQALDHKCFVCSFDSGLKPLSTIISVISHPTVLLVGKAGVPRENRQPWQVNDKPYQVRCKSNATFLCGIKSDTNSNCIGDRLH